MRASGGALQSPVQQVAAQPRMGVNTQKSEDEKPAIFSTLRKNTTPCNDKGLQKVGHTGLEPVTSRV